MSQHQVVIHRIENSARFSSDSNPGREECVLCHRMIQQHEDFGWWFIEDESGWVPSHKSDSTDAYETQQGWICSTDCFNDHTVSPEEMEGVA